MKPYFRFTRLFCAIGIMLLLNACGGPWKSGGNAAAEIEQARLAAQQSNKLVLLEFGANWCPDSRALASMMKRDEFQAVVSPHFVPVRIDVGYRDRNMDIANAYGNPVKKGMPALVVITPNNKVVTGSFNGELGNVKQMERSEVLAYLERLLKR